MDSVDMLFKALNFTTTGKRFRQSKYKPHQGKQEIDRRRRQILRGQLKPENGLDISYIPQYIFK